VLSASAILPIFLTIGAGSRTPIMGLHPVRGRPRFFSRHSGVSKFVTRSVGGDAQAPSIAAELPFGNCFVEVNGAELRTLATPEPIKD
jgi:hypothetical protein